MPTHVCDVAILGGGMAGCLLARQLNRHVPDAHVVLLERDVTRARKVGESTVDVCGKYLTKRLGLSRYLYENHLPKNGLRFFFDRADRQGRLDQLSEIGSTGLIPFPSFQLDRARLEQDLLHMNADDGVDVRVGVRVTAIEAGAPHTLRLSQDGVEAGALRARWVVDASGRASVLAKQNNLRCDSDLRHAAAWGRFTGVLDLDEHGGEAFRARVNHTARVLSTNHFCYPGYWIWLIPLGRGVTSVGVVMERGRFDASLSREAGFLAFLRQHGAIAELLQSAKLLDHGALTQLSYGTTRLLDARERWALVGDAAAFTDPLYSPGGDFIALANDWTTDLIRRDLAGEGEPALAERAALYDRAFALRNQATLRLYRDLYGLLGSYSLFSSKWDLDLACYLDTWVEPYLFDTHLDLGAVRRELEAAPVTLGLLESFSRTFRAAHETLTREGRVDRENLGHAVLDPARRFVGWDFGTEASRRLATVRIRDAAELVLAELRQKLGHAAPASRIPFAELTTGRALL